MTFTLQHSCHFSHVWVTEQPETIGIDKTLAKCEGDSKYYQKSISVSLSDSFCFVYLCFVHIRGEFLFSILVEIDDIFVE